MRGRDDSMLVWQVGLAGRPIGGAKLGGADVAMVLAALDDGVVYPIPVPCRWQLNRVGLAVVADPGVIVIGQVVRHSLAREEVIGALAIVGDGAVQVVTSEPIADVNVDRSSYELRVEIAGAGRCLVHEWMHETSPALANTTARRPEAASA